MVEIRHILCPVDFSEASQHALDHAVVIAGWYRARITLMHVHHPAFMIQPPVLFAEMQAPAETLEDAEARLQHWLQPVRAAGIECDALAMEGNNAAARIIGTAERLSTDIIVIGTHGRTGFDRLLLGSVTEKVVRTAKCAVVTVPPPSVASSSLPFKRLLCGVDFSEPSLGALRFALSIAKESGSTLTVLHALEMPVENEAMARVDIGAFRAAVRQDAEMRLAKLFTEEDRTWCQPVTQLVFGKAYEQILAAAAEQKVDMIVLGVHGRGPLDMLVFGSTTNQVIRKATCPVLTLRR